MIEQSFASAAVQVSFFFQRTITFLTFFAHVGAYDGENISKAVEINPFNISRIETSFYRGETSQQNSLRYSPQ